MRLFFFLYTNLVFCWLGKKENVQIDCRRFQRTNNSEQQTMTPKDNEDEPVCEIVLTFFFCCPFDFVWNQGEKINKEKVLLGGNWKAIIEIRIWSTTTAKLTKGRLPKHAWIFVINLSLVEKQTMNAIGLRSLGSWSNSCQDLSTDSIEGTRSRSSNSSKVIAFPLIKIRVNFIGHWSVEEVIVCVPRPQLSPLLRLCSPKWTSFIALLLGLLWKLVVLFRHTQTHTLFSHLMPLQLQLPLRM